jgi:ABC-type phosphate transport system permease subunit
MEANIKVARAHRALSWLYGGLGVVCVVSAALFIFSEPTLVDANLLALFGFMALCFGGLFLLHHVTARGAREKKPWARITSSVIAVFMLLGFPLGTIIGIYLLIYANSEWADRAVTGASGRVTG